MARNLKLLALLLVVVVAAALWLRRRPVPPLPVDARVVHVSVGLDSTAEHVWHHLGEGAGIIPLNVLLSLENVDTGEPFVESMRRYGLRPDSAQPNGLPVGFAVETLRADGSGAAMVGVTCSMCHSGAYTYRGTALLIDGAPNLVDVEALLQALARSMAATTLEPRKLLGALHRFAAAEHRPGRAGEAFELDPEALGLLNALVDTASAEHAEARAHVAATLHAAYHAATPEEAERVIDSGSVAIADTGATGSGLRRILEGLHADLGWLERQVEHLVKVAEAFRNQTPAGPGRSDSFNVIWDLMVQHDSIVPLSAPVSIPHLFHYREFEWVHWDGNSNTVFSRDFSQAIALGADYDPATGASGVQPRQIMAIEEAARRIRSPAWPEDVLGAPDRDLAAQGEEVFRRECASCHDGGGKVVPVAEVGTDPLRAMGFAELRQGGKSYADLLVELGDKVAARAFADHSITPEEIAATERAPDPTWKATGGYYARSLRGVWATAPYLHNGSVPTLWHLLQPASARPTRFPVGRELDPVSVGIDILAQPEGTWVLDTSVPANRNTGHEFGVALDDAAKRALVEYLKTL